MEIPFLLVFLTVGTAIAVMQESRSEPVIIHSDSEANIHQIRTIRESPKQTAAKPINKEANAKFDPEYALFEEDSLLPRKELEAQGESRKKPRVMRPREAQARREMPIPNIFDSRPSFGVPSPPDGDRTVNEVNVRSPAQVSPSDKAKYDAYADFVKLLRESVDLTVDPCEDFQQYVCGNNKKPVALQYTDLQNNLQTAELLEDPKYNSPTTSEAMKKTIRFYNKCMAFRSNSAQNIQSATKIKKIMDDFSADTNWRFPMVSDPSLPQQTYDVQALSKALALLSRQGVHTLVTPFVYDNWKAPQDYAFFLDQNTLHYSKSRYTADAWNATVKPAYKRYVMQLVKDYVSVSSPTTSLDPTLLSQNVDELLEFEHELATIYSTDDATQRNFDRSHNNYTMATASTAFTFLDFAAYFKALSGDNADLNTHLTTSTFFVMEPEKLGMLNDYQLLNSNKVINYLFYRLLAANDDYLPRSSAARIPPFEERNAKPPKCRPFAPARYPNNHKAQCAAETVLCMEYASVRFLVDYLYPEDDSKKTVKDSVGYIVNNVRLSFRGMLNRLDWMTPKSKIGAYNKIDQLVTKIGYPDFILNDTLLDSYYDALVFNEDDDYTEMSNKLREFLTNPKINAKIDTENFSFGDTVTNARYKPWLNLIWFAVGILQKPFFDVNWPASLNYGALGTIAGHEITHGFDTQGIEYDGVGRKSNWMDDQSRANFTAMVDCLVKQYSGFCPLNCAGQCVKGSLTQGENIADNGGIHAAWNSYKEYTALHEPDPQLPDPMFEHFTHDQLFFLAFSQMWCEEQNGDEDQCKSLKNTHYLYSPPKYRVLGSLKNFPAFRTAFNCPAPTEDRCSVWVPNVQNGA